MSGCLCGPCLVPFTGHEIVPGGVLFWHADGAPLTHYQFWVVTARALDILGLKGVRFGTHSFRIGAASMAGQMGYPESRIKDMGRWKSNAFRRYVHPLLC